MHIEDRIEELEKHVEELTEKITRLESIKNDKWISAKELAQLMDCSVNTVYIKIRSGEIFASKRLGSPKIPMSQFYEGMFRDHILLEKQETNLNEIKERIF